MKIRIAGVGDLIRCNCDYGVMNFLLSYDNPIKKIHHVPGFSKGIIPESLDGSLPLKTIVKFNDEENVVKAADVPDSSILSSIIIHYDKKGYYFYGLSFLDKKSNCVLKVGYTPDIQNNIAHHSIPFGKNDRLIGMRARLQYPKESAYCCDMHLIIGRVGE